MPGILALSNLDDRRRLLQPTGKRAFEDDSAL